MPKKHSRAKQRERLKLEAKWEGISFGELQKRLKLDGNTVGQVSEGVQTTEAGQDWVAEEGGKNTPASGISAMQDGATTLGDGCAMEDMATFCKRSSPNGGAMNPKSLHTSQGERASSSLRHGGQQSVAAHWLRWSCDGGCSINIAQTRVSLV